MQLASRFASRSPVIRSRVPLTDEQLADVVPSIFAEEKHDSRSERYTYIPTINILQRLRKECVFHMKSATDSTANRPPFPWQTGR